MLINAHLLLRFDFESWVQMGPFRSMASCAAARANDERPEEMLICLIGALVRG